MAPNNLYTNRPPPQVRYENSGPGKVEGSSSLCGSLCGYVIIFFSYFLVFIFAPFSLFFCIKVVQQYERAVIYRLGKLGSGGAKGPGLFFILPCVDSCQKIDMRTISYNIPPQEVLTRDSVTIAVDAVVFYRIQNATDSVNNVNDVGMSTQLLAQTTLRNTLGIKTLTQILSERESISRDIQEHLGEVSTRWGVNVERVELKDVRLPMSMQRAMATEAEATRNARAKIIAAEGEQQASLALKEAADMLSQSPSALQLRYLQTLCTVAEEKNSTIIFPLPMEFLSQFRHLKQF
ncbi:hypothetical protein HELRODRAFT_116789 [Helobdella robusta]|uniref:Band 7 domain-containing protein n=1 Tax=Helobdella robusta TaxID=6412 RepID=T1EGH8_HELRO|nr:hypothetical protein HELRODRAFT_116789 [Helobdella robusta]ESO11442.1 hypothetical protein HELRODRAFT_116789 [Helobdella robusta]